MESLIIFGGSFDPIHNGHLRMAAAASLALNANVVFVPAKNPRWKEPATTVKQRLEMLRLAIKEYGSPSFTIDLFEVNSKAETNYTIDTVHHFKKKYPKHRLYLLIGGDSVNTFSKWKNADEIASLANIVFVSRPEISIDYTIVDKFHMKRLRFNGSGLVSSTDVRTLNDGDIPRSVRRYIEIHGLYYAKLVKAAVGERRYAHCLAVAHLSYAIALKNKKVDPSMAYIAGLAHDYGKHLGEKETQRIMSKAFKEYSSFPPWTFHQFVGSLLVEEDFGLKNKEILDAIEFHATGKPNMSELAKTIYAADKIEPTRGYDSSDLIRACLKNLDKGFVKVLKENVKFQQEKGREIDNQLTRDCVNYYLKEKHGK